MSNPLFLGIDNDNTDLNNQEVRLKLEDPNVELVDWEEWRDRQPLYRFGSVISRLLLPILKIPFGSMMHRTTDYVWDYLSDIPSVNKYIASAEYMLYIDKLAKELPTVIYGHSLGCIPALKADKTTGKKPATYDLYYKTGVQIPVVLMSPPIGYKPFHKYFLVSDPPFTEDVPVTMTFGDYDWLCKVISQRHKRGDNPLNVNPIIGLVGHSFSEHAKVYTNKVRVRELKLGKLFELIGRA